MHEIDFNKTFLLTVKCKLLQVLLAMSYIFGLLINQINIVGAYLRSLLSKNNLPIFMKLPSGFYNFGAI